MMGIALTHETNRVHPYLTLLSLIGKATAMKMVDNYMLQHDLYLVYNDAMYFNAPGTTYYKQAVGIRNLVERPLYVLVTDLENLIAECGKETAINIEKTKGCS